MSPFDLALSFAPDLMADKSYTDVLTLARQVTGACRQTGTHAGGVVIGRLPLSHYTPLTSEGLTMYDMKDVEAAGLVKFDFLGLKTLDVIDAASRDAGIDIHDVAIDDGGVLESMTSTWGLFQVESPGMEALCRDLVIDSFADIVAAVALYRPGPKESGMLDEFIARKHGQRAVKYPHPLVKEALSTTRGTIVYQEQVMQVARAMAGYTLGGADILRRAMGKKMAEEMERQHAVFVDGCLANDIDEAVAEDVFSAMSKHAAYSFNLSHSVAYALITYQTAYLKHHHLAQFVAALLTVEFDDREVMARYVRDARASGIKILGPDVNKSDDRFTVDGPESVRWGLAAVNGLGHVQVPKLVASRPYTDFFDLVSRSGVGPGGIESLIACGACDCFGHERSSLSETMAAAADVKMARELESLSGQTSLLVDDPHVTEVGPWEDQLEREFASLGVYVSGHPTAGMDLPPSVGVIVDVHEKRSRKTGRLWARVTFENDRGHTSALVFADAYEQLADRLEVGKIMSFLGRTNEAGELIVDKCRPYKR